MDKAIEHLTEMIRAENDPHVVSLISQAILSLAQAYEIMRRNSPPG